MPSLDTGKLTLSYQTKKPFFYILLVLPSLLLFCAFPAFAARPLTTEDTWTVEKGTFQLEAGVDATRQDNHDRETTPSLILSYGLLQRMDMGIGSAYSFVHPKDRENEKGFGDTEVKLKYRPLDEKDWRPAFAVLGKLKIPTASQSKGLGTGKTDIAMMAIATKNLSKRVVLHLNLGYTFIGEHGANNELNYSGAVQFILTDEWALVGEIVAVNNCNGRHGDDPFSGLIGAYYLITDKIIWDAGVEIGMNKAAPDFRITTGLTMLFKR
jgi:hypothetical protein